MQANYGENEIKSLLQKVRIFNKEIGSYELFSITDTFDYAVKLSNGKILLKIEELQDDEKGVLTPERLTSIANRFTSSGEQKNDKEKLKNHVTQSSSTISKEALNTKNKDKIRTILIVIIVLIGIYAIINKMNRNGLGYNSGDTYQEKVMSIEEIERSNPKNFLSADGTYRETFWGDKFKVSCKVTNKATVATYKDAVIRVTYYTKTKTVLGTKDYTIYETFPPKTTKTIDLKIDNYNNVNYLGWELLSAKAY